MNLLFIDESTCEIKGSKERLVSVTGVLVPARKYAYARRRFYERFRREEDWGGKIITTRDGRKLQVAEGTKVRVPPAELHAVDLLPGASDDERIATLASAVALVVEAELTVFRCCVLMDASMLAQCPTDAVRYHQTWILLESLLESLLEQEPVVPVWDAGNKGIEERMPETMRLRDHLRALTPARAIPDVTENLLGEIFFADSKQSIFVQIADLISYTLLARDKLAVGWPATPWIERVAGVATTLPPRNLSEITGRLEIRSSARVISPY